MGGKHEISDEHYIRHSIRLVLNVLRDIENAPCMRGLRLEKGLAESMCYLKEAIKTLEEMK